MKLWEVYVSFGSLNDDSYDEMYYTVQATSELTAKIQAAQELNHLKNIQAHFVAV